MIKDLSLIKTKDNLNMVLSDIESFSKDIFKEGSTDRTELLKAYDILFSSLLTEVLDCDINKISNDDLLENLNELRAELSQLETLSLTIAFTPSQNFIDSLYSWIVENLGSKVIIDFKNSQKVIGGALISYQGKYKDYSVDKKLGEYTNVKLS